MDTSIAPVLGGPRLTFAYRLVPETVWQPADNAEWVVREGADVAEFTDLLALKGYPPGMRVIVRRNGPTPAPGCGSTMSRGTG